MPRRLLLEFGLRKRKSRRRERAVSCFNCRWCISQVNGIRWLSTYVLTICKLSARVSTCSVVTGSFVHLPLFCIHFTNVRTDCSYECTPSSVNVFVKGITPPGRSELSQAATTPCRLQQCAVLWSSADNQYGDCSVQYQGAQLATNMVTAVCSIRELS
jgi:hypothetical protein